MGASCECHSMDSIASATMTWAVFGGSGETWQFQIASPSVSGIHSSLHWNEEDNENERELKDAGGCIQMDDLTHNCFVQFGVPMFRSQEETILS